MNRFASMVVAAAALVAAAPSSSAGQAAARPVHLLDVPYLPQSEALCGGAAAAMVMRYWGERDIYADAFASLVDRDAGGIHARDLVQALSDRGWTAAALAGDARAVGRSLDGGRPVITLIEDRPGRFHFVVIVGWAAGRVVFHDPARAPFRVAGEAAFLDRWASAGYWMMVLSPRRAINSAIPASSDAPSPSSPCGAMVQEGVRLAGAGQAGDAGALFEMAAAACPEASAPWRELAGLAALRDDWAGAADAARHALALDASDAHAARTLATALFLQDRVDDALAVWNGLGEPVIDLIEVKGLDRIRYDVVARTLDLEPRTLLTPDALARARRRLAELPGALQSQVRYVPAEGSRAVVDALVVERPLVPWGAIPLAALSLRALIDRELGATVGSPSGGGDALAVRWRWWESRPRAGVAYSAPAPGGVGATWALEAFGERQTYLLSNRRIRESREGASLRIADWPSGALRWEVTLGMDRWSGDRTSMSFGGSVEHHAMGNRLVTGVSTSLFAGGLRAAAASAHASWRSNVRREGIVWAADASLDGADDAAPLALWAGAGTGHGRPALLRAHPLLDDGVIASPVFGRRLAAAGVEVRRWLAPTRAAVQFAPALFADVARAWRGFADGAPAQVDVGAGLRVSLPFAGVLRLDYAHGLRDGADAWSVGWTR